MGSILEWILNLSPGKLSGGDWRFDFASEFGSQVIIGLIRGNISEAASRSKQLAFLESSLSDLTSYAEKKKILLTIEPLNCYECNILNTASETIDLIKRIGSSNLRVLLDTFHMNIEEANMSQTIVASRDYLSHVHVADSNRKPPGMGHVDFKEICSALRTIGYNGFLSGEMLPYPNLEMAVQQYFKKMKEVLHA